MRDLATLLVSACNLRDEIEQHKDRTSHGYEYLEEAAGLADELITDLKMAISDINEQEADENRRLLHLGYERDYNKLFAI